MEDELKEIIELASDRSLSNLIVNSYKEVERNYFLKSWKTSELDAGHFVEAVRRFLELKLFGRYTPVGRSLPPFNGQTMDRYLNASGDEAYRIHIPRALLTIYGIRNRRGVGHLALIEPNHLDATLIISSVKWILAEIVRLNSTLEIPQTVKLVDHIVDRDVEGIWEEVDITRVLVDGLKLSEQIMFLLFATAVTKDEELRNIIETKDKSYFKKTLKKLHSERFIEYRESGECVISPKGRAFTEQLILEKVKV